MRRTTRRLGLTVLAAALLAAPACTGGGGDVLASYRPQIGNSADLFELRVGGLTAVSTTHEYVWTNHEQKAGVTQAVQLGGGSGTVTIFDAANTQVYQQPLGANGSFETLAGTPGRWRIRVELSGTSGTVALRVQKVALPVIS